MTDKKKGPAKPGWYALTAPSATSADGRETVALVRSTSKKRAQVALGAALFEATRVNDDRLVELSDKGLPRLDGLADSLRLTKPIVVQPMERK